MPKDRDNDSSAAAGQLKQRPPLSHQVSHDSDSQVSDQTSQTSSSSHVRPKIHKHHSHHYVGAGRVTPRVPSSKALHKSHHATPSVKLNLQHKRQPSHSPEQPEPSPMLPSAHRRAASDVRLSRDSSASNLKKNASHTSLQRNRSHVEVGKKSKSAANIKRSTSHKEVSKLKGGKSSVHFDLGNDGQDDEWVDASGSASPYLSRRGSVASSAQVPTKHDTEISPQRETPPTKIRTEPQESPDQQRVQHKEYLTSRLLQRTPSHGAPPKMTSETAAAVPRSISPDSAISRASSTLYGSSNVTKPSVGTAAGDELISRFVSGPGSGVNTAVGSFYSPTHPVTRVKRPQSLGNLHHEHHSSATGEHEEEDESALAPRTRRPTHKAAPADKSRTQQKLNLQRASSSIEPVPAGGGGGLGAVGASPLLGGAGYDNRDPRIGKLIERTGQEYLVVRRYQNPIARSIARLQQLPGANKMQHIPKQNGANGSLHVKKQSDLAAARQNHTLGSGDAHRSRPANTGRVTSIRTNGANSSYEADGSRPRLSGSSDLGGDDDGVAALLRNLWDKNMDLSASQD